MLKQRLLTALVLIPPLVWGILALPSPAIAVILGVFVLVAGWEWAALCALDDARQRTAFVVALGGLLWVLWTLSDVSAWSAGVLYLAALWWVAVLVWVSRHAAAQLPAAGAWPAGSRLGAGLITLVPAWWALVWLHGSERYGPVMVLYVLVLIWVADSGAYFAGRRWGRRRLAPGISPGKTREGAAGAFAATALLALAAGLTWGLRGTGLLGFVILSLVGTLFSILGDLFESVLKRQANVKDSGRLFPGHGGVLDRIDSVTAAAPVFVTALVLSGIAP